MDESKDRQTESEWVTDYWQTDIKRWTDGLTELAEWWTDKQTDRLNNRY